MPRKKTVCYSNIYKALRKSYDTHDYVKVNDEWCARFAYVGVGPELRARLWNVETDAEYVTGALLCCNSMTELIRFATERLLGYWYEDTPECWEDKRRRAFENACDCLRHGYGRCYWNPCGCKDPDAVWKEAFEYMAETA